MVLGWGRLSSGVAVSQRISAGRGAKASTMATSVRWPLPVLAREPYRVARKRSAWGYSFLNRAAAWLGPMVWELEGPRPMR